jgi:purine catabolism regulator
MPVLISDLLAVPALGLRPLTSHCSRVDHPITWVSTTELPDPLPFLGGGELVMTTGMLERSEEDWRGLVRRLADLPVAAVCFGVGLVHQAVPDVVVSAAEDSGLALVSSPVEVPFVQISRWVADRLFAEQYDAVQAMVTVQDRLVKELLSHNGLRGLLRRLHRELQCGAVAVLAADGRVVDRFPARGEYKPAPAGDARGATSVPIVVDDVPVATLCTQEPTALPEVLAFAATILGLEVARQQAVLTGRRELLGQVLEDVLHRTASEGDAKRRLAAYGIAAEEVHTVVVARVSGPPERLRRLPWTLGPLLERAGDRLPTALVDDGVVVVVPSDVDAGHTAAVVAGHLALLDAKVRVGVGEARRGLSGLRLGYFEARQAAQTGPGVHRAAPLSVTGLLLGNLDLPLRELGHGVLAPLLEHDMRSGGDLVTTLRSYLANDCQPAATAADLVLHRNSLRYRLALIERLTGRDLDRLTDRMELWLALSAYDAG